MTLSNNFPESDNQPRTVAECSLWRRSLQYRFRGVIHSPVLVLIADCDHTTLLNLLMQKSTERQLFRRVDIQHAAIELSKK